MMPSDGRPWLDELAAATERFRAAVASADEAGALTSAVVACPGWDLRELVVHLGQTHLWATGILRGADPRDRPQDTPAADQRPADWYIGIAEQMLKEMEEAGPEAQCWTLVAEQRTAQFWRRRQLHETTIHLWDAEHALERSTEIDPALAFDGVAEVAEVMYPRMLRAERVRPLPKSLAFVATDLKAEPVIIGGSEPSLVVRAPAAELLLLIWHRLPWDPAYGGQEAAGLISRSLVP